MSTVRETFGLVCPKCGSDESIEIWAYTMIRLTPDGSVEAKNAGHEWGPDHHCECRRCGHQAQVYAFDIDNTEVAP